LISVDKIKSIEITYLCKAAKSFLKMENCTYRF